MRPLILHNVPDEELYIGEDGIQRPYAMIFPEGDRQRDAPRRRAVAESGSFGKSTRRSRSRTGSLPPKREDATMQAADKIFSDFVSKQEQLPAAGSQRKPSYLSQSSVPDDGASAQTPRIVQEPTEVILRGYKSSIQQYAAINHYEQLAGRICEDYPREPPIEQRRYKSELRDPAFTRRQTLTPQEKTKVNMVDGGEHWIKITFESADAASAAMYASPQKILGHLVFAELYRGLPPMEDAAVVEMVTDAAMLQDEVPSSRAQSLRRLQKSKQSSFAKAGRATGTDLDLNNSPPESRGSTQTIDSATLSTTGTASSATVTGSAPNGSASYNGLSKLNTTNAEPENDDYCRKIPTARRAKLLTAEQALLPQQGLVQRIASRVPLIRWFSGSMIGDEVPRLDNGEFDFNKASLYWRLMYLMDSWFGLFGHEIDHPEKDD